MGMARLLLIDDDPKHVKLLHAQLSALGHEVLTAIDGEDGLAQLFADDGGISVVITDLTMPKVDGRAVVQRIRASPDHAQLAIIIVSATRDAADINDLLRDGRTRFMGKPIDFFGLSSTIARYTNRRTTEEVTLTPEQVEMLASAKPCKPIDINQEA